MWYERSCGKTPLLCRGVVVIEGGIKMASPECIEHCSSDIGVVDRLITIVFQVGDVEGNQLA